MNGNQNNNPNQWNNQWNNGPQQPEQSQQPGSQKGPGQHQGAPPQYYGVQPQPPQYQQQPQQQWQPINAAGANGGATTSATTPPSTEPKKKSPALKIGALLAAIVLAIAGGIFVVTQTGIGKRLAEMSYIASADPGPEAFMNSVAEDDAAEIVQASNLGSGSLAGGVEGNADNLYGGTGELSTCDAAALLDNLGDNDELNSAFAQGIGINSDDVERYVRALNPLILMQDTWVTNHGFQDGRANPFQAVLQRGTAVLVDANGVPRVRCACGNPLAEAWDGYTAPSTDNASWDGYEAGSVVAVFDAGESYRQLKIRDLQADEAAELEITDDQVDTQSDVYDAVTSDTPKTVPSDMDVKPDEELLNSLGMSVADNGDERPTGGERFQTNSGSFAPDGSPAAAEEPQEETTMIDASEFMTYTDTYLIPFEDQRGWCLAKEFTDEFTLSCRPMALDTDLKKSFSDGDPSLAAPLTDVNYVPAVGRFMTMSSATTEGPSGHRTEPRYLAVGESVEIRGFTCSNLSDRFVCEKNGSTLEAIDDDGVYIDGSPEKIGANCGMADFHDGGTADVRVFDGNVDCAEAMEIAQAFADDVDRFHIDDWTCSRLGSEYATKLGWSDTCSKDGGVGSVVLVNT